MATPATIPVLAEIGDILLSDFDGAFKRYAPIFPKYTRVMNGERSPETVQPLMYFSELQSVAIGADTPFQEPAEAYKSTASIDSSLRARGFQVSELALKVDRSGRLRRAAEKLGVSAQHTKETIAAGLLNNGFTTNHATRAVPLFSNSQPLFGGGTYDNLISGDLSVAVLDSAYIQFQNFVDDRGLKINIMPKFLAVTPSDRRVALQLVGSPKEPFSSENQINVFANEMQVIVNPWFSDADNAFLLADAEESGLVLVQWQDVRRKAWVDEGTAADTLKFKATYSGLVIDGGIDFRGSVGIQGA